tara:strand:+ start:50 stop:256 length:207 start_codon:yes stop_codon:yes gene_type:complete
MEGEEGIMERLASLVYLKGKRQYYKKHYEDKYKSRIEYLVNFNNQLMKELEQYDDGTPEEHRLKRDML